MSEAPAWTPPAEFAEYRLLRPLGHGAMGEVFLAEDLLLGREVAIKFIAPRGGAEPDEAQRQRLFVEARAIARLSHPNVVAIYRVGEVRRRPYLVSEFVRGESLDRVARPMAAERVLAIGLDLARGLAAAHRAGVLHRDLKPANAILGDSGEAKLLDFGLAKLVNEETLRPEPVPSLLAAPAARDAWTTTAETIDGRAGGAATVDGGAAAAAAAVTAPDAGRARGRPAGDGDGGSLGARRAVAAEFTPAALTRQGAFVGSPLYLAPECWSGEPATRHSDLYSLGVLLYELAAGRAPHHGVALAELGDAVITREVPPLPARSPAEQRLASIVARCLQRDPSRRWESADALREALREALQPRLEAAVPDSDPYLGLHPFGAADRAFFFGRDAEVRAVCERLESSPFVLLAGDSGVGKSSLCCAGVLPLVEARGLESGGRSGAARAALVLRVVPGRHPLGALAAALAPVLGVDDDALRERLRAEPRSLGRALRQARPDGDTLLFVDQLEELVTLPEASEAAEAAAVLAALAAPTRGVRLLAAARSDFLARLAALPLLGDEVERALMLLRPLDEAGRREAIVGPARAKGVRFESEAMVASLVASAGEDGLPLLQFALAELWRARDVEAAVIPARALEAIGGVAGALAGHADRVVGALLPSQHAAARRLLTRLVTSEGTRARRGAPELGGGATDGPVLDALVRGRLVVAHAPDSVSDGDGPIYEIAHEALIDGWDTLRAWLGNDAERRGAHHRLERAAAEWERLGRPREALWGRRLLAEIESLTRPGAAAASDDELAPGPRERSFVEASRRANLRRSAAVVAAAAAAPLLLLGALGVARLQARRNVALHVEERLAESRAALGEARRGGQAVTAQRARSFAAFDAGRADEGEAIWSATLGAEEEVDRGLARAAQAAETALLLDPGHAAARRALAETLYERALVAERDHRPRQRDELLARLAGYDDGGSLRSLLAAPARIDVTTLPPGAAVTLQRVSVEEVSGRRAPGAADAIGASPVEGLALPAGSYLLTFQRPGAASAPEVRLPIRIGRGEQLRLEVPLPERVPSGYVYVPPGRFLFGSSDEEEVRRALTAQPEHTVATGAFLIGRTEVTFADWIEFLDSLPPTEQARRRPVGRDVALDRLADGRWHLALRPAGAVLEAAWGEPVHYPHRDRRATQDWRRFPVVGIAWDDARAYYAWLDATGRLPGARACTEHEWERAARGADDRRWPHGDQLLADDADFDETYGRRAGDYGPDEVGSHPSSASPFGVLDLAGSVWEATRAVTVSEEIANRGGSWYQDRWSSRSDQREFGESTLRTIRHGVRVCAPAGR